MSLNNTSTIDDVDDDHDEHNDDAGEATDVVKDKAETETPNEALKISEEEDVKNIPETLPEVATAEVERSADEATAENENQLPVAVDENNDKSHDSSKENQTAEAGSLAKAISLSNANEVLAQ